MSLQFWRGGNDVDCEDDGNPAVQRRTLGLVSWSSRCILSLANVVSAAARRGTITDSRGKAVMDRATPDAGANASFRRVLDPVDRASEILFGLIMVMTFTSSLSAAQAGRADVKAMLIGALGCNLAWGIIDAVMFFMSSMAERRLSERTFQAVRAADSAIAARRIIAGALPALVVPALSAGDLDRIRLHLISLSLEEVRARPRAQDFVGALAVFLLIFLLTFPVVAPFLFITNAVIALRVSNVIAIALLFSTGYTLGRHSGHPWRTGLLMVAVGLTLVAIASVLGG